MVNQEFTQKLTFTSPQKTKNISKSTSNFLSRERLASCFDLSLTLHDEMLLVMHDKLGKFIITMEIYISVNRKRKGKFKEPESAGLNRNYNSARVRPHVRITYLR